MWSWRMEVKAKWKRKMRGKVRGTKEVRRESVSSNSSQVRASVGFARPEEVWGAMGKTTQQHRRRWNRWNLNGCLGLIFYRKELRRTMVMRLPCCLQSIGRRKEAIGFLWVFVLD
ncbi:uncharacterized protein LOC111887890 [Lactuca sativa]|uniref:uncharacterized protein LOC111887890 n=1 Tax=Lactuca sativa TaxID=4236 RepID=UPI000CC1C510|nr:uncharacterized protein LOC111887890 [Lactuca sativa]